MSKLLRANFTRLWKSRIFWIGILYAFGIGFFASTTPYRESLEIEGYHPHFDNNLFTNSLFMPIVCAVFIGLFIGTEFSNGTIRNKIIVGHTRSAVYLSNLIVSIVAILIMHLTNFATIVILGGTLVGNREMPIGYLIMLGIMSIVTLIALCAFFLLISMLIKSKSTASVAAIIISFVFLLAAMSIANSLAQPEYWDAYHLSFTDESGEVIEENVERQKNPHYLTGMKREIYEFLNDFLPGSQMLQIAYQEIDVSQSGVKLPVYSLLIAVSTTACGVYFFRRKNLN